MWLMQPKTNPRLQATPPSTLDMVDHLYEHHADLMNSVTDFAPQCMSPTPFCCAYCWKSTAVVDQCPLTVNLAAHLVRHASLRDDARRSDGAADRRIRDPARESKAQRTQETQARDRHGVERYLRPTSKDDASAGHTRASSRLWRCRIPSSSSFNSNIEHPTVRPAVHLRLEAGSRTAECQPISSPKAHHHDHPDSPGTHVEGGAIHSRDRDLAGGPSPSAHYRKWLLELLGMECEGAQSPAHEQTTSLHDQHAEHPRGTGGACPGPCSSGPLQIIEDSGRGELPHQSPTMDDANQPSTP